MEYDHNLWYFIAIIIANKIYLIYNLVWIVKITLDIKIALWGNEFKRNIIKNSSLLIWVNNYAD